MSAAPSASPFERPSAREVQRQRTRARLFQAALAEFARAGFDQASVAEIARAADVSRPSFYFHFPTKEHVLLELQWRKELDLVERLSGCETLRELLGKLPDSIADVYASIEGPHVARDMVMIYARLPEYLPLEEQPFPLVRLLERRFAEGARRGELRAGIDPSQATFLCLTSVFGYLIGAPPSADHRANLRAVVGLFLA
jgi:AcrR family transcriptional regulator